MDFLQSNFLQVLDLLIFRQKQPGHWAEVVCHFHLLVSMSFPLEADGIALDLSCYLSNQVDCFCAECERRCVHDGLCESQEFLSIILVLFLTQFALLLQVGEEGLEGVEGADDGELAVEGRN